MKNNKSNNQNATKTTKTTFSIKKCLFANESELLRIHIGRKGRGSYIKIIGVWGRVYGVLIPGIALVAGPHRPENLAEKIFCIDFDDPKCDFFCFLENMAELYRMVNVGFLGAFRGPKE